MKIRENILDEGGARGETSLRTVLEQIAKEIGIMNTNYNGQWDLHHFNGKHGDNNIDNLIIMEHGAHSSYHNKLRANGINVESIEADNFLKNNYKDKYIEIGKYLRKLISMAENKDDKNIGA